MVKKVVIVHRWDGTPRSDWYPWLEKELEKKGLEVSVPEMPATETPEIDKWVPFLSKVVIRLSLCLKYTQQRG